MLTLTQKPLLYFSSYPPAGEADWRYTFATALVRTLEDKMLSAQMLTEMANAKDLNGLSQMLAGTEYAFPSGAADNQPEQMLIGRRAETRKLFEQLIDDCLIAEMFRSRTDFANIRLAIRRFVIEKPTGSDYCPDGSISTEQLQDAFEQNDYSNLPQHLQEAIEAGILGYYKNKNVRDIDIEIDRVESDFMLNRADSLGSVFLTELMRMQIDLTNIRTMMRIKFSLSDNLSRQDASKNLKEQQAPGRNTVTALTDSQNTEVFLTGGYIEKSRLIECLDIGYEALSQHFYATPYYHLIETGAVYLQKENSFLKLEAACDRHLNGYLDSTSQIAAGHQPIVAYLLKKEHEIRNVRLIITAKKNELDTKLIIDRIS